MNVLHKCDVRCCCNPDHLFLGTVADNNHDMIAKSRHQHGEKHSFAKLTEADIREIRASTAPAVALAPKYGVNSQAISNIRHRTTWRHVK
jgi:hypothetical protein